MVRAIERYMCEVCKTEYDELLDAGQCEKQGKPIPAFPIGIQIKILHGKRKGQTAKIVEQHYNQKHEISYNLEVQDSPDQIHWVFKASEEEVMLLMMEEVKGKKKKVKN